VLAPERTGDIESQIEKKKRKKGMGKFLSSQSPSPSPPLDLPPKDESTNLF
jgi:hypothetical protein